MKPILYQATETVFSSKGRGTIADAISCTVTEARNGIFDLEMQISVNSKRFSEIALDKIILAKPNPYDWPQPFRIHKITKPINGIVTVLANHISYDLKGMPVNPFTATSCSEAVAMLKSSSLITCPFTITTDIVSSTVMTVAKPYTIRDLMGGMEGSLIDTYGGEYKFNRFSVMLLSERGANRGVKIKYGINLIDLTQEENCSSVYSGVLPYFANENGIVVGDVQRASGTFAVDRILPLDLTQYFTSGYDESATLPTVAQLNTRGAAYVMNNAVGVPKVNLELSFAQLPRKEVHLCDTVTVEFEKMGIETTAKVIETVYDVLEERYRSVKLGDPRANIINSINDETEAREAANVRMQSYLEKTDSAIRAKVSKIGGDNTSFGWEMTDTSHTWYSNEEEVMKATSAGLEIKGKITATSGFIGNGSNGFTIGDTAIYNRLSSLSGNQNGIYLGTDGIALGGGKFKVTSAGALTATSAEIKGKITATSGYIGNDSSGFTIGSNAIYNGMTSLSDVEHNGVYIGTGGIALGKGAFKVTSSGAVTASNLSITGGTISINNGAFYVSSDGSVTANSGTFKGNIYAKNIQYSSSDANIGTFSGAGLTDLSILEDKLRNNTISTAKTSAGINTSLGYANFANAVMNNNDTAEHISCKLLTVRGGPLIVSGRVSASYLVGVHKVLSGDDEYDMSIHTHQITEENGVVTIGAADWTGADHSFNIADTDFYKDGVSAVTVKSYGFEQDENQETDYTSLYVVLGLNGTTTNTVGNLDISGSYNAGQNAGARTATISAVTIGATGAPSYSSEDQAWYATAAVAGTSRGTLADGTYYTNANAYSRNVAIDVTSTYNAGKDAGAQTAYVSAITTSVAGSPSWSSEDSVYYANVSVTATARGTKSDGTYYTADRTITKAVDVTAVYEAGQTSGAANVTLTLTDSQTGFNSNTHKKTVTVDAVVANASGTTVRTGSKDVEVDATSVYNSGQNAGAQTAYFSAVSAGAAGTPSWNAEDQVYYANVSITGTARGTKADGSYYTDSRSITCAVDVSAVYEAGQTSGAANVTLTLTDSQSGFDSTTHKKNVTVNAVVANAGGTTVQTDSKVVEVDATSVYNAGVTAGAETAYVSAITAGSAGLPSYSSEDQKYYANTSITATARGTKADGTYYTAGRTITVAVNVTNVYTTAKQLGVTEGARTAYVSAITAGAAGTPSYSSEDDVYYANVAITATARGTQAGGTYYTADRTINTAVDVTAVYNAGKASGGGSVQTITSVAATASNYGTYDKAIAPSFASLYTSGAYSYGLANIALSNGDETLLRFRVPAVNDITVARPNGDMQDWDLSESNHVYVNVNLSALSNSTVLATDTGRVNVDDIVNFWAPHQTTILATTSVSDSNNYDLDVDTTGYTNAYFKSGNYQYVRFQLQNADGNGLSIVRVKTVSTDMSISEVSGLTSDSVTYQNYNRQVSFVASSLYTPSGSSTQYARVQVNLSNGTNEVIRVAIPAGSSGGSVTRADYDSGYYSSSIKYYKYVGTWPNGTGYVRAQCGTQYGDLDVTSLVMEAISIGQQQASGSSVTVRSVKATSNKTYDSNMDMYYVMVRVTYSDGSWQNFQAWYD